MEGDNCLVCFEPSSGPAGLGQQPHNYDDDDSRLLSNKTFAKIFNLSTRQKTKLIRNSSTIYTCSKCSSKLQQIHRIYEGLKALEDHLSSLKDSLKNSILSSFSASNGNYGIGLVHSIREVIVKGKSHNSDDNETDIDESNFDGSQLVHSISSIREEIVVQGKPHSDNDEPADLLDEQNPSKYQLESDLVIKKEDIFEQNDHVDLCLEHYDDVKSPPIEVSESPKSKTVQNKMIEMCSIGKMIVQEKEKEVEEDTIERRSKRKRKASRKFFDEYDDLSLPQDKDPDYEPPELDDIILTNENKIIYSDKLLTKICLEIKPNLILRPIPYQQRYRSISIHDDLIKNFIEKEKCHLKEQQHKPTGNNSIFKCPLCFKPITGLRNLLAHLKSLKHAYKQEPCTDCDPIKYFLNIEALERHKKLRHSYPKPKVILNPDDNNKKFYICPEPSCSKRYKSREHYRVHYKFMHDPNKMRLCADCGKTFKTTYLKEHIAVKHGNDDNEQFICDQCCNVFKSKKTLYRHQISLHGPLNYKCQYEGCDRAFRLKSKLKWHEVKEHLKERRFDCELCPSKFFLGIELNIHVKKMHSNDPKVVCQTCGLSFRQSYITVHQKQLHEKEFHHFCHLCNKGYYRMTELKVHIKNHPGKKHLKCPFPKCDKTFSSNSSWNSHKISHSDLYKYHCQICQKQFKRRKSLNEHMQLNHNSNPNTYSCQCGADFKIKRYLIFHKKKCGG